MNKKFFFLYYSVWAAWALAQVVVLHLPLDYVFFLTLFLISLSVQINSFVIIGCAFIVWGTYPFLVLLGRTDIVSSVMQWSFFLIIIGVIVQLWSLASQALRIDWLRLDMSFLIDPFIFKAKFVWQKVISYFERLILKQKKSYQIVLQIAAGVGLVLSFLAAMISKGSPSAMILGLAIGLLIPFIIWLSFLIIQLSGVDRFFRVLLILGGLPLLATQFVFLHDSLTSYQLQHSTILYRFADHMNEANQSANQDGEVKVGVWQINDQTLMGIFQHPGSSGNNQIYFPIPIPKIKLQYLAFDIGMVPDSWYQAGDGVSFSIYFMCGQDSQQIFSTYIDPKHNMEHRRWIPYTVALPQCEKEKVIILETNAGPFGNLNYDWAVWGNPRIVEK